MWGVAIGFSLSVPLLASVSAISFMLILECARTLCTWILCGVQYIWCTMAAMSSLSRWWCYDIGDIQPYGCELDCHILL